VNGETLSIDPPAVRPAQVARPRQAHPAGPNDELTALLTGIPVVARRAILGRNETLAAVQADIDRYRRDPEKFEAALEAELARRG
jgi:hypothetical protein